jgi:sugar lactone lactonase YvrE
MLGGGLLLAMRDGLWRFDPASGRRERARATALRRCTTERFNDGKADSVGRLWVGTIYEPRDPPKAALYRWNRGALDRMAGDITVSNGVAWSPDGRTMYWSDTKAHASTPSISMRLDGTLSGRRLFKQFPPAPPGSLGRLRRPPRRCRGRQ